MTAGSGAAFMQGFTHLEVHSQYTLLGAAPSIDDLIERAKGDHLAHLALTDSNALYGAVAFDSACRSAGIQPIIGMASSVAPPGEAERAASRHDPGKLVLLAKNRAGYRSLCRLSTLLQGRKDRESILSRGLLWSELGHHNEGLICLSGGLDGWAARLLKEGNLEGAGNYIVELARIYKENTFLSLEIHQPADLELSKETASIGSRLGLPVIAVQPIYYMNPEDSSKLRLLMAVDRIAKVDEVDDNLAGYHWLSPADIAKRFATIPESLTSHTEITSQCEPALPDGQAVFPVLKVESETGSVEELLAKKAGEGLKVRYGSSPARSTVDRLNVELESINLTGYASLFLIVADIVRYARENDIPVSTRGSVANSLAAYCVGITTVDPIANDLLFERFINPARKNPPDIDMDFCSRRRDRILEYVRDTYGRDRVALVATISTMQPKSAVRETAKAHGLDEESTSLLVKRLPSRWHPDPRRRDSRTMLDLVDDLEDEKQREVIRAASQIVGQPHHLSIHPGGVVITPGPLTDYVPLQWAPKGFLITQYPHQDLEQIGLPKLDLLGIRALTVLADAADLIREYHDPGFRLQEIDLEDSATGDLLERGESIGVFQCESAGAQRTMRQLKARNLQDLAVANAFFKPGPATGGMAQAFIRRYRGEEKVHYLHPALEQILKSTQGVLLFQEQILRVATEIAGLSWEQADHLRRGMSKFKPEEMEALQTDFQSGCQRPPPAGPGFSEEQARRLWEQVRAFAGYGFNRGHATAYGDVSYRSAFLKAHWPEAFLCARLADRGGFHHPAIYMAEAVRLGIKVMPPHINFSDRKFTLTYGYIKLPSVSAPGSRVADPRSPSLFMGLDQIRDLRRKSIKTIIQERKRSTFSDLNDVLLRVNLQQKEILHLIRCGALDGLGASRAALEEEALAVKRAGSVRQTSFSFVERNIEPESPAERLEWERFILGMPVGVHPLDLVDEPQENLTPLARLAADREQFEASQPLKVIGVRLPGWTGGPGFFLGDRETFITVRQGKRGDKEPGPPEPWKPLLVRGRWLRDEWGTAWLQAEQLAPIPYQVSR